MHPDPALARAISASLARICNHSSFFATLALFAEIEATSELPTAATDGKSIFVNPAFFSGLTAAEQDGLLLHEVLHAALLHLPRRGGRDPKLWNVAADIVINGMIVNEGLTLPEGGLRDPLRERLSVEEVYDLLLSDAERKKQQPNAIGDDLLDGPPGDAGQPQPAGTGEGEQLKPATMATPGEAGGEGERHWRQAMDQARTVARTSVAGREPAGLARELSSIGAAQLDWRSYLWRYLTQTPTDFGAFDRRFVGDELYLETLSGESVRVMVAIDTSGSVDGPLIETLVGELRGILTAYPHLRADLYYADAALYGPYPLTARDPIPTPIGGGGTDFRPFLAAIDKHQFAGGTTVAIYLTDGWGTFPKHAPRVPVLWVVTPGGRDLAQFPFGEAVRLLRSQHTPFVKW